MLDPADIGSALLLVIAANSAPWLAGRLLHARWDRAIDSSRQLADGRPILGAHKTWRGVAAAVIACAAVAHFLGLGALNGAGFGALAMLGDLASSFVKRRLDLRPGSEVPGLDQLPEALLPLIVLSPRLSLDGAEILLVAGLFAVMDLAVYRLRR